jgi:hypothetical protein
MNISDRHILWAYGCIVTFALMCLYVVFGINAELIGTLVSGAWWAIPLMDWIQFGVTLLIGAAGWGYGVYPLLVDLYTTFDDAGIHRPGIGRERLIRWYEVVGVRNSLFLIEIKTPDGVEAINMLFNRDNRRVFRYIEEQIAKSRTHPSTP